MFLVLSFGVVTGVAAQSGDGTLRGNVRDSQGGALPGVTVTATSPALFEPSVTVTDVAGQYRLINLPPGTYTVTAELPGFSMFRREGVLMRAGATFQVDIKDPANPTFVGRAWLPGQKDGEPGFEDQ